MSAITLPSGVKVRDLYDPQVVRGLIYHRVRDEYLNKFPLQNDKVRIDLLNADYDEKKLRPSLEDEEDAIMKGGRLVAPLRGTVRLTDKLTGKPLDEREVVLANVPAMTDQGHFVMGGIPYAVSNQSRLKPGFYARQKENGELEAHANIRPGTGASMRLSMEPDTGVYRVSVGKANIKLYPVLNALGVPDEKLKEQWGEDVLKQNQNAYDRNAFGKFYTKLMGSRARRESRLPT